MDPTALPTDNLYKFLALTGALLAGVVWLAITRKMDGLTERKAQLAADKAKLALSIQQLAASEAGLNQIDLEEKLRASRELALKEVELNAFIRAYQHFETAGEKLATKAVIVVVMLSALSLWSFWRWYDKVQVHLDQQVIDAKREQKAKADQAELELERARRGEKDRPVLPRP